MPTPASFVADGPGILTADARHEVDARIREIQAASLGDIGVAILPNLNGYTPAEVGVAIYRTWRIGSVAEIGSAHRNVGALLLIVPKELAPDGKGQCWITTGTGAEGIVTDAASGAICREAIIPHLLQQDYSTAVLAGITAIEARLRQDAGLTASGSERGVAVPTQVHGSPARGFPWAPVSGGLLGLLGLIGVIRGVLRWRRTRPRNCTECGKSMNRLGETEDDEFLAVGQQIEEHLGSVDYDVWVCDKGHELVIPYRKWFTRYHACRSCGYRAAWYRRRVILPPTTASTGLAELRWRCEACLTRWQTTVIIPRIATSNSAHSSHSPGGGGGGSSFGGSGSTSGGGGGSSY